MKKTTTQSGGVGPEDERPVTQAFIQAQLSYKARLIELRDTISEQDKKVSSKAVKRKLSELLQEIESELPRITSGIDSKSEKVKKGRLKLVA